MRKLLFFLLLIPFFGQSQRVVGDNTLVTKKEVMSLYSTISPSQLTSDQDNWNPTGLDDATTIRVSGDNGVRAITSIVAPTQTYKPQIKRLINVGSFPLYLPSEHPDGTAANRFLIPSDFILNPYQNVDIQYDVTSSRWRVLGENNIIVKKGISYQWAASSSTVGDINDFTYVATGTSSAGTGTASSTTIPASLLMATGTTTTGSVNAYFAKTALTFSAFAAAHIYAECYLNVPTLSDGTETYTSYLMLTGGTPASTTQEPNNSVFIRYSHGINSGKWQLVSQDNAGTESTADLGITVAANTSYKLRIEIDKTKTEVRAYIDNLYVGRVTANLPNSVANGARASIFKSAGTTSRTMNLFTLAAGAIYP